MKRRNKGKSHLGTDTKVRLGPYGLKGWEVVQNHGDFVWFFMWKLVILSPLLSLTQQNIFICGWSAVMFTLSGHFSFSTNMSENKTYKVFTSCMDMFAYPAVWEIALNINMMFKIMVKKEKTTKKNKLLQMIDYTVKSHFN